MQDAFKFKPLTDVELRLELVASLVDIQGMIEATKEVAAELGCSPYVLKHADQSAMLAPLLASKAQVLYALTILNERK